MVDGIRLGCSNGGMESKFRLVSGGYYLDHGSRKSERCAMRLEADLQTHPFRENGPGVWIRVREDTPMSTGGSEAAIWLSIEEASGLVDSLLEFIHYTLPELRKRDPQE